MSKHKAIYYGIFSSYLFLFISIIIQFKFTPYIFNFLKESSYGLYIVIFQIASYLAFFDFGLSSSINRFISKETTDNNINYLTINKVVNSGLLSFIILGLFPIITMFLFSENFIDFFKIKNTEKGNIIFLLRSLSVLIFFQFLLKPFSSIIFSLHKQLLSNTIQFFIFIFQFFLSLFFLNKGQYLWSFFYAQLIAIIINYLVIFFCIVKYFPFIKIGAKFYDKKIVKKMFSYGFYLFLNGIAVQIIFQSDKMFVGSLVSLSAVSLYTFNIKLPELAMGLIWKITDNAFPLLASVSNDKVKLKEIHQKLMLITINCSLIAFGLIYIYSKDFLNLWLKSNYFLGYETLVISLCTFLILHTILHVSAVCLNSAGHAKGFAYISVVDACINFFLSLYLGKKYGINGILFSTLFSGIFTSSIFVIRSTIKVLRLNIIEYFYPIFRILVIYVFFYVLIYYLKNIYFKTIDNWLVLVLLVFITSVISIYLSWISSLRKILYSYLPSKLKIFL